MDLITKKNEVEFSLLSIIKIKDIKNLLGISYDTAQTMYAEIKEENKVKRVCFKQLLNYLNI